MSRRYRHKFIEYIQSKYGEVYQCRTFSVLGAKGSIRKAGKALGWTTEAADEVAKMVSKYESDDDDDNTSSYDQKIWMLDHIKTKENEELIELAKKFVGLIYGFSKHASALIVLDGDITQFCSVERQTDSKTHEPNYVAACNFKYLEEMNLMKLDMLGLKTLDVIQDTLDSLDNPPDIDNLPVDDEETSEMLIKGRTTGCFQISSSGMTQLIKQIKPKEFADLIPLVALFRPGPLDATVEETGDTMVQTYVKVRNGEIKPQYLHPKLEPILKDTYSIILYQEQILEIAKKLCGYSLGEADMLRRIIGKKKVDEMKPAVEQMISRGVVNGIPKDIMQKITNQIVEFASYCFNRGHSAGYGLTTYKTSYLKAHYPLQYMCACLNNEDGQQKDFLPLIRECKELGIEILPPSLQKKNLLWQIEGDSIRVGLHYIKNVGKKLNLDHTESFADIVSHNPKDITEALIKAGALDYLEIDRSILLTNLSPLQDILKRQDECLLKIAENEQKLSEAVAEKEIKKYTRLLTQWKQKLAECQAKEIQQATGKYDCAAGEMETLLFSFRKLPKVKQGTITSIYSKNDRTGRKMGWLTFKTKYGEIKATVFANGWKLIGDKVKQGETYVFVVDDGGILEEIQIDGQTYKTNERKRWGR